MRWEEEIPYIELGEEFSEWTDGRGWAAPYLPALAERYGEEGTADAVISGLDAAAQDPGQQLRCSWSRPTPSGLGTEGLNGTEVTHHRGALSVEDTLEGGADNDSLTEEKRERLAQTVRDEGVESYDIDAWVDANDVPVTAVPCPSPDSLRPAALPPAARRWRYPASGYGGNASCSLHLCCALLHLLTGPRARPPHA